MLDRLIFSPGCLNSSDLKVSLTSFTGGKKSCNVILDTSRNEIWSSLHPEQRPPPGKAPVARSLGNVTSRAHLPCQAGPLWYLLQGESPIPILSRTEPWIWALQAMHLTYNLMPFVIKMSLRAQLGKVTEEGTPPGSVNRFSILGKRLSG